jgi:hypothetical protein
MHCAVCTFTFRGIQIVGLSACMPFCLSICPFHVSTTAQHSAMAGRCRKHAAERQVLTLGSLVGTLKHLRGTLLRDYRAIEIASEVALRYVRFHRRRLLFEKNFMMQREENKQVREKREWRRRSSCCKSKQVLGPMQSQNTESNTYNNSVGVSCVE